jgi:glycolate oxidase iron-sulfur subunit
MQTRIPSDFLDTAAGQEANAILRKCVHCGFCNATCPTYQLKGDELDGPRGRIYLIKQMLEGQEAGDGTMLHLDRCLTCRNCETTCPSGVEYGRLLDIGRVEAESRISRPWQQRFARTVLRKTLARPWLFRPLLGLGRLARPFLPHAWAVKIPERQSPPTWPKARHARRMLVLDGCVQPALAPNINAQAARVLDKLGISLIRVRRAACCGALSQHLSAPQEARDFMRRNIDAWWSEVEAGAEAIVTTASACGAQVKDYGHLLQDDARYSEKATRISALARDIGEVLAVEDLAPLAGKSLRLAYHPPCTLQHGQKLPGLVENVLRKLGHVVLPVSDAHLCCGAAGTYSLLQPEMSQQLREEKVSALMAARPEVIVSANIGCITHLGVAAGVPVKHWIELFDI